MTIDKDKLKALAEAARDYSGSDLIEHESRYNALACEVDPVTVLAMLAEIDDQALQARSAREVCLESQATILSLISERDQLKAENEALRKALGKISVQVDGNIRCTVRDVVNGLPDVQDIYDYCDNIDEIIAAAMAKEAALYAFKPLGDES